MYNTKRAINTLKDLDGLKIRVGGGLVNEITRNLGAVPMLKPAPESYELLSTGVADGLFFPKESPLSFKLVPLIKHVTYVPGGLYNVSFAWIANQAKWNQIPEADRKAIQPLLARRSRADRARPGMRPTRKAKRRCARPRSRSSSQRSAARRDQGEDRAARARMDREEGETQGRRWRGGAEGPARRDREVAEEIVAGRSPRREFA